MNFILKKRLIIFYFIDTFALVSILSFLYYNIEKIAFDSNRVEQSQRVLRTSNEVLLGLFIIESASSDYVNTGNERFLTAYNNGIVTLRDKIAKLFLLTNDNILQHARVDSLKTRIEESLINTKNRIDESKNQSQRTRPRL